MQETQPWGCEQEGNPKALTVALTNDHAVLHEPQVLNLGCKRGTEGGVLPEGQTYFRIVQRCYTFFNLRCFLTWMCKYNYNHMKDLLFAH